MLKFLDGIGNGRGNDDLTTSMAIFRFKKNK